MPKELYDPKEILTKCAFFDEICKIILFQNVNYLQKNKNKNSNKKIKTIKNEYNLLKFFI